MFPEQHFNVFKFWPEYIGCFFQEKITKTQEIMIENQKKTQEAKEEEDLRTRDLLREFITGTGSHMQQIISVQAF